MWSVLTVNQHMKNQGTWLDPYLIKTSDYEQYLDGSCTYLTII